MLAHARIRLLAHRQLVGDVQVACDGETDGVLAGRERCQHQIHAIFRGRRHHGAVGEAAQVDAEQRPEVIRQDVTLRGRTGRIRSFDTSKAAGSPNT
jgi:hypothetical protein